MTFSELGLEESFVNKCEKAGFTEPTPIQEQAIPHVLAGRDVIASAETGTGKTAAFLLPSLQKIGKMRQKAPGVLVLSPTRELANQTEAACIKFGQKWVNCVSIIGGASYFKQNAGIRRGADVIVATPGRLIDFMERRAIDLSKIHTLVLDEADRMLDMGFLPPIKKILAMLPESRQVLLFTATLSKEIQGLTASITRDAVTIEISRKGKAAETIDQKAYPVAPTSKHDLLLDVLNKEEIDRVLVFTRTKFGADKLSDFLDRKSAHRSSRIHGDRSQSQREAALRQFRRGDSKILVATDVAARGIHIEAVSHVINFDVPVSPEDYVHRIGRTGRAGREGRAITFLTRDEERAMRAIEKLMGEKVERVLMPEFGGKLEQPRTEERKKRTFGQKRRFGGGFDRDRSSAPKSPWGGFKKKNDRGRRTFGSAKAGL